MRLSRVLICIAFVTLVSLPVASQAVGQERSLDWWQARNEPISTTDTPARYEGPLGTQPSADVRAERDLDWWQTRNTRASTTDTPDTVNQVAGGGSTGSMDGFLGNERVDDRRRVQQRQVVRNRDRRVVQQDHNQRIVQRQNQRIVQDRRVVADGDFDRNRRVIVREDGTRRDTTARDVSVRTGDGGRIDISQDATASGEHASVVQKIIVNVKSTLGDMVSGVSFTEETAASAKNGVASASQRGVVAGVGSGTLGVAQRSDANARGNDTRAAADQRIGVDYGNGTESVISREQGAATGGDASTSLQQQAQIHSSLGETGVSGATNCFRHSHSHARQHHGHHHDAPHMHSHRHC